MNNMRYQNELTLLRELYETYRATERAEKIAKELLARFGTAERVLLAPHAELASIPTVTESDAAFLKLYLAIDSRRRAERFRFGEIPTEQQICDYLSAIFLGKSEETIYLMSFDKEGRAIACDCVASGTVNAAAVSARRLLDFAISRRAYTVILAHNHPGGTTIPSNEDLRLTGSYASLFGTAGIRLLEHYIVAGMSCDGLMQKMSTELRATED